jgi:hypothetical protein
LLFIEYCGTTIGITPIPYCTDIKIINSKTLIEQMEQIIVQDIEAICKKENAMSPKWQ